MTATAISTGHNPAQALKARTAWMANRDMKEPLHTVGTVIRVAEGHEIFAEGSSGRGFLPQGCLECRRNLQIPE